MFSHATDLFLIDLPEQGFVPRLGSCAARSSSKQNLTKTVFFDHLQWCLNRSLSSFALNYSVGEPLFAIVPQQEQGYAGVAGHGSDVTALSVPRSVQATKKTPSLAGRQTNSNYLLLIVSPITVNSFPISRLRRLAYILFKTVKCLGNRRNYTERHHKRNPENSANDFAIFVPSALTTHSFSSYKYRNDKLDDDCFHNQRLSFSNDIHFQI